MKAENTRAGMIVDDEMVKAVTLGTATGGVDVLLQSGESLWLAYGQEIEVFVPGFARVENESFSQQPFEGGVKVWISSENIATGCGTQPVSNLELEPVAEILTD